LILPRIQISNKDFDSFAGLLERENNLIVNMPITQNLFDKITTLAPSVWEVLIPAEVYRNVVEFKNHYDFISLNPDPFKICDQLKIKTLIQSNKTQRQIYTLPPELAFIYTLRNISIPRIFIALAILQHCNITKLKELIDISFQTHKKIFNLLLELTKIRLYRTDQVWELLVKHGYERELGRFSLYLRDFIKDEYQYEKIM